MSALVSSSPAFVKTYTPSPIEFSFIEERVLYELEPRQLYGDLREKISSGLVRTLCGKIHTKYGFVTRCDLISYTTGMVRNGNFTGSVAFWCKCKFSVLRPYTGCELTVRVVEKDPGVFILSRYRCVDVMINRGLPAGNEAMYDRIQVGDFVKVKLLGVRIGSEPTDNNGGGYFSIGEIIEEIDMGASTILPNLSFSWLPNFETPIVATDLQSLAVSNRDEQIADIRDRVVDLGNKRVSNTHDLSVWDLVNFMSNPGEMVANTAYAGNFGKPVCDHVVVGWSFFSMWEILVKFPWLVADKEEIQAMFLNEAPGGNVQAVWEFLGKTSAGKYVVGLPTDDGKILTWGKLKNPVHDRYFSLFGAPLFLIEDWASNQSAFGDPGRFDLIVGNGGAVYDIDTPNQESDHWPLLWREFLVVLYHQRRGGCAILKLMGTKSKVVQQMLGLLSTVYSEVHLYKPTMSRPTNSESFVLLRNYLGGGESLAEAGWSVPAPGNIWQGEVSSDLMDDFSGILLSWNNRIDSQVVSFLQTAYGYYDQRVYVDLESRLNIKRNQRDFAIKWCNRMKLPVVSPLGDLDPLQVDGRGERGERGERANRTDKS